MKEADACEHGQLGHLLRREKLYSSQLQKWREELAKKGVQGLSKTQPGPKPSKTAEQRRIDQLEKENARLQKRLDIAEGCLDLQKKTLSMIEQMKAGSMA